MTAILKTIRRGMGGAVLAAATALLLAGCDYLPGSTPFPTITPDATIQAVPRMLTQTAGAPTITLTPRRSATPAPTATVTATATPYPGSADTPVEIGERVMMDLETASFTVLSASAPKSIPNQRAIEGTDYVEVELLIENQGQADVEYNRMDFRLVTGGGDALEPLPASAGRLLLSGMLRPGEWVRGSAAFRIPAQENSGGLSLRWHAPSARREKWVRVQVGQAAGQEIVPATGSPNGSEALPSPGQKVSASGITVSIDKVESGQFAYRRRAETGFRFVLLHVTIANDARDKAPFNPEYFRVKDEAGYEYIPTVLPSEELVGAGSLNRGRRVSGVVIFELPVDARSIVVKYRPQVLVDPYEEIRVRVELE